MVFPLVYSISTAFGPKSAFLRDSLSSVDHVALDDFDLVFELHSGGGVDVTSNGSDFVLVEYLWIIEYVVFEGTSLLTGSSEDGKSIGHFV